MGRRRQHESGSFFTLHRVPTLPRLPCPDLQDHMFAAFVSKGIVDDLTGYYNKEQQK